MKYLAILGLTSVYLAVPASAAVIVPVSDAVQLATQSAGLTGRIWQNRDANGAPTAAGWGNFSQADAALNTSGRPADMTFTAANLSYGTQTGSSSQSVNSFIGSDSGSLNPSSDGSLELRAVLFSLQGYLYVPSAGTYSFTTASDDGILITIGSSASPQLGFDGARGNSSETQSVTFGAGGYYALQVRYFNSLDGGAEMSVWSDISGSNSVLASPYLFTGNPVPEPASMGFAAAGAVAVLAIVRRRKAA